MKTKKILTTTIYLMSVLVLAAVMLAACGKKNGTGDAGGIGTGKAAYGAGDNGADGAAYGAGDDEAGGAAYGTDGAGAGAMEITALRTNYAAEPLCVEGTPLFGWQMQGPGQGASQSAYRIMVAVSEEALAQGAYVWDSGRISSGISVGIPYAGEPLSSAADYYWTVDVWDQNDAPITCRSAAHFKTGLTEQDWQGAQWITASGQGEETGAQSGKAFSGTISYSVYCKHSQSAFFWGADNSYYGDYYRLEIDTIADAPTLQFAAMHYENVTDKILFPIETDDPALWGDSIHTVSISVQGADVSLTVDEAPAGSFTLPALRPLYSFGFWTTRGVYYAYYDDLRIVSDSDGLLCEEDFEHPDTHVFSPFFCKMTEGMEPLSGRWLTVSSGFLITPDSMQCAPLFRKTFQTSAGKTVEQALLYAGALGTYDLYLNGACADDSFFSPGQSQYDQEVFYRAMDVTDLITPGENTIAAMLGHGRYDRAKCQWGDRLSLCALLALRYTDGSIDYISTDDSWLCCTDGPVRNDDMYAGEFYDASKEIPHWNDNSGSAAGPLWKSAAIMAFDGIQPRPQLVAAAAPANKCVEALSPVSVTEPVPGTYVCDFGTNITGLCELSFTGTAGEPVIMRYAEHLNEEHFADADDLPGTIWTQGLFTAKNTDYCLPASGDETVYMPRLVYRGFRYVQITGTRLPVTAADLRALVITAGNDRTGTFSCSDEGINTLYHAIYRTQLNNYVDIPTDCPQRDERFGWAGDAQVFAHTADYNADVYNFLRSYLRTFTLAQRDSGAFPDLINSSYEGGGSNGWADAGIILTWELYEQYGDVSIISEHLDAMCRYMDYLVETSDDFIRPMVSYSDHGAVSVLADDMCNTVQCAYAARLLSKMCAAADRPDLAAKYQTVFDQYKKAWQNTFLNEDGSVGSWMQSEYVLPLAFELYPEALAETGAENLNISVESSGFHVYTGYVSTPWLLPVLCRYGYTDSAYALIRQNSFPSWNYMFSHGGTTLTETFQTYRDYDDGTYSIVGSLNHYALGSVGQWLYSDVLGIKRDENAPGFKHFYLEPRIHDSLSFAKGSYASVYGTIESSWTLEGGMITYECTVPPNTTATLILPAADFAVKELTAGHYIFSELSLK